MDHVPISLVRRSEVNRGAAPSHADAEPRSEPGPWRDVAAAVTIERFVAGRGTRWQATMSLTV